MLLFAHLCIHAATTDFVGWLRWLLLWMGLPIFPTSRSGWRPGPRPPFKRASSKTSLLKEHLQDLPLHRPAPRPPYMTKHSSKTLLWKQTSFKTSLYKDQRQCLLLTKPTQRHSFTDTAQRPPLKETQSFGITLKRSVHEHLYKETSPWASL